jgi:hypothetical protein
MFYSTVEYNYNSMTEFTFQSFTNRAGIKRTSMLVYCSEEKGLCRSDLEAVGGLFLPAIKEE